VAAETGHVHVLEWAHVHMETIQASGCGDDAFEGDLANGHLACCQWLHCQAVPLCYLVAIYGNLEILKWLRSHDCPWCDSAVTTGALMNHWEVVVWAVENGCPYNEQDVAILRQHAYRYGRMDVIGFLDFL